MSEQAVTTQQAQPPATRVPMPIGARGLEIRDLDSLWRFSQYVAKSGLAPKGMESPEAIFVAVEMGMELNIPPMMALQNIGVINGRPGVFGDLPLALVRNSGLLEEYREEEIGKSGEDSWGFRVTARRVGCPPKTETFTVADAKRAQLWGKAGPWSQWPKRMLKFRARGFLLRDEFGDVLKGVKTVEELAELNEEDRVRHAKPAKVASFPEPPPAPPVAQSAKHPTLVEQPISPEEKAEAEAGLAPEQTTPVPEGEKNPGTRLGELLAAAEITWDQFSRYGQQTGWKAPWENVDGFEALGVLDPKQCEDWIVINKRIIAMVNKAKAEGRVQP